MIIGISGKFCSGKDNLADIFVNDYGFIKIGFADKLYEVARDLFGMKGKDRSLLQDLGHNMRSIRDTIWIDYLFNHIDNHKNYVIKDVRYKNEFERCLIENCVLIRLYCPQEVCIQRYLELYGVKPTQEQIEHSSEIDLDEELRFNRIIDTNVYGKQTMLTIAKEISYAIR